MFWGFKMATLESALRQGLKGAVHGISAVEECRGAVLRRGRRKKAVRRTVAAAGLSCLALLGFAGFPRLDLGDGAAIAPAGRVGSQVLSVRVTVDPPKGWRLEQETAGLLRFEGPRDAELLLLDPEVVADPRRTFGTAAPGPTVLVAWMGGLGDITGSRPQPSEVGGSGSISVAGTYERDRDDALLELVGGREVAPSPGQHVVLHALEDVPILVIGWDSDGGREVANLLAMLRFDR